MIPYTKFAKVIFIALLCITGALVLYSLGVSIWSLIGEEGWVAKSAWAVFSWIVTFPFLLTSIICSVVLSVTKQSRKGKYLDRRSSKKA